MLGSALRSRLQPTQWAHHAQRGSSLNLVLVLLLCAASIAKTSHCAQSRKRPFESSWRLRSTYLAVGSTPHAIIDQYLA